jgi:hypothetical protein
MRKSGFLGCAHFAMTLIEAEGLRNLFTRLVGRAVMLVVVANIALRPSVRESLGLGDADNARSDRPVRASAPSPKLHGGTSWARPC